MVNEKYPGYPKIDKKILPDIKSKNRDIDKAREKIEDFLRDNIDFFIDAFMLYTPRTSGTSSVEDLASLALAVEDRE